MAATRICILGPAASGKTTLAARLAETHGLPRVELDRLHWDDAAPGYGVRRDPAERDRLLAEAVAGDAWVVEGVYYQWLGSAFERAQQIVFLDAPLWKRQARIGMRALRRTAGLERGSHKESWRSVWELAAWDREWDQKNRPGMFAALEPHRGKVRVLRDIREY